MKNKIVLETVETIIDNLEEKLVDYMFEYGEYSETNDEFYSDKEEFTKLVIKELNSRLRELEQYILTKLITQINYLLYTMSIRQVKDNINVTKTN